MPRVYFGFDAESAPDEHIFVSYSRGDADRVREIVFELHKIGLPIWYDDGLIPGNLWKKEILRQVKQSRMTVFFLTKDLFKRDRTFMIDEYQFAKDHKRQKVFIWLDDIGQLDCTSLDDDMYFWWLELKQLHSIEVFHLNTEKEKSEEIYLGLCRKDHFFTHYSKGAHTKKTVQPTASSSIQSAYSDTALRTVVPDIPAANYHVSIGMKMPFGFYPQGESGEIQPLIWRVLCIEEGKALLLSDKLIEYVAYNKGFSNTTWETCTLRNWLNSEFIGFAFHSDQQNKIATVTNRNNSGTTQDKIFLLSISEVKKYLSSDKDRIAYTTDYLHAKGFDNRDRTAFWWLRSSGTFGNRAARILDGGDIDRGGFNVNDTKVALRPAFWLTL